MLTNTQINDFINEVTTAYNTAAHLITEDTIRSLLIKALNVPVSDIEIEVPYVVNSGRKINGKRDYTPIKVLNSTWFNSERNRADIYYYTDDMVIEVKYHRATPYSDSCTTSKAGEVFNDLNRLSMIDAKNKYFVYVFDSDMHDTYNKGGTHYDAKIIKTTFNIGNTAVIDNNYPITSTSKKVKNFKENAFKTFTDTHSNFICFDYDVQCVYNAPIVQGKLWCIILKVDRNKKA